MGKLTFFIKRLFRMDFRRMWDTTNTLKERAGKSRLWLLADMLYCGIRYNAGYMDYKIAAMYRLNSAQRATVITRGINNQIVRDMNDRQYWHCFDDKAEFNTLFARWVNRLAARRQRADAGAPGRVPERQGSRVHRPIEGSSGVGVRKASRNEWADTAQFMADILRAGDSIIEEAVIQHPKMASLCPSSVNTVRIATLLGTKKEGIVYAFLRIGNGKVMDNVDCGGMAARVDLDSGTLLTVAADKAGQVFSTHPMTGTDIVGFQLPFFEEAKQMCLDAMRVVPQVRYVAWDVALTEKGPRFIEGNSFPSHAVPQFAAHYPDGIGILPEFRKFIDV